jgi:hypothetical protein
VPQLPGVAGHRLATRARAAVLTLGGLVLALRVAGLPLSAMAHQLSLSNQLSAVLILAGAAVGVVVAWHQPGNPLGWILLAAVALVTVSTDALFYSVVDYRLYHGASPFGPVAVLLQLCWAPAIVLLGLGILLFPDGRVPAPRWRWLVWIYLAVGALWLAGAFALAASVIIGHSVQVDSGGNLLIIDHPSGRYAWWGAAEAVFFPVLGLCWLASLAGQAASWRRSSGERRQQLKWLMAGSAVCLAGLIPSSLLGDASGFWGMVGQVGSLCVLALPGSIGVAILKYRLYDIDRIISRTLAYALLTGLLVGVYAGLVLLATQVLAIKSPVAVAVATLAAAALFTPLRHRVQRLVDRRFNRARYDADTTVAAFAARLKDAVDLDAVRDDLAGVVSQALEPAHVSVWVSRRG